MIAVGMTDDHVFDVVRIELQLNKTVDDFRLGCPCKVRVDNDEARAGTQCPGGMLPRAEPIEVVKHLVRRGIPVRRIR
jgi:hypothetical protein